MDEKRLGLSTENLPDNPPRPSQRGSWIPEGVRKELDPCDGCGVPKSPDEFSKFFAKDLSLDADEAPPMLCNYCATYGPPMEDPLAEMNVRERQAMLMLAAGGTVAGAARHIGMSKEKLRDILSGRERGVFREAFQKMLVSEGLGPDSIVNAIKRSITGKKYQWNQDTSEFQEFEDHAAQTRAADMLIKLFDLKPPQELARNVEPATGKGVVVNIQTNVGDGKNIRTDEYEVVGVVIDE